jgi:hypothetical protein
MDFQKRLPLTLVKRGGALALLAAALGCLTGCGPIQTISYIQQTKAELEGAESADAQKLAPYEYTAAVAYLEKAREEHGHAEFTASTEFGEKALKFARSARAKAMEAKADGAMPEAAAGAGGDSAQAQPSPMQEKTSVEADEPRL